MLGRVLAVATRAPRATLGLLVALAVAGLLAGVFVPVDGRLDRLAPSGSAAAKAGETERDSFGGDAALIVIRGDMVKTLTSEADRLRVGGLEGCLAGIVDPATKKGPCYRIEQLGAVKSVDGPVTYLNSAIVQIGDTIDQRREQIMQTAADARTAATEQATKDGKSKAEATKIGDAARNYVLLQSLADVNEYAKSLGLSGINDDVSVRSDAFAKRVLFAKGDNGKYGPKRRLAALIPNRETAIIQVRLKPDLSASERAEATEALKEAMLNKAFGLGLTDASLEFTGLAPATQTLSDAIRTSALALGAAALLVMAAVLLLARRLKRRLLPVLVAASVLGTAILALAIPERALSLAVVVALPILVGLAVDQAVQAQLRLERRVNATALRTLVIAGAAAAASALALLASPFGVVRTVSVTLAASILLAIVAAAAASAAAISLAKRRDAAASEAEAVPPSAQGLRAAMSDADALIAGSAPVRGTLAAARSLTDRAARITPRAALAIVVTAVLVAGAGAVLGAKATVETNLTALVPASSSGAKQLEQLRRQTGASASISLVLTTKPENVGNPELWRYLVAAQRQVAAGTDGRCDGRSLCNPLPLDELFGTKSNGKLPTDEQIEVALSILPSSLSRSIIDPDKGVISIPFGIGTLDAVKQREYVAKLDRIADAAPSGTEAAVTGLPAVVAAGAQSLESPERRLVLAALAILLPGLVLLATLRSFRRTVVALVPPLLALGWSELAMWLLGVPRTPLTAALGVLVAAVAVEFSVLLGERYAALRRVGLAKDRAIAATLRETGGAVAISAGATIAGFAVLGLASIPVISEFGIATAVDLSLVLVALVAVGPATWVLADRTPESRPARSTTAASGPALPAR